MVVKWWLNNINGVFIMMKKVYKKIILAALMLTVGASISCASQEELQWMKENDVIFNSRADFIQAQQDYIDANAVASDAAPVALDELTSIANDGQHSDITTFNGVFLPDELIAHIISFLDTHSFGKSALVCKHLKNVIDHMPTSHKIEKLLKICQPTQKEPFEKEKQALDFAIKYDLTWALKYILRMVSNELIL